jgi:Crp-like helix-turn-helix domain
VGTDQFDITHELLGQMLGCRRATVSLTAAVLQGAGLIRYRRGHVAILDRPRLEEASCECYRVIRGLFQRAEIAADDGDDDGGPEAA